MHLSCLKQKLAAAAPQWHCPTDVDVLLLSLESLQVDAHSAHHGDSNEPSHLPSGLAQDSSQGGGQQSHHLHSTSRAPAATRISNAVSRTVSNVPPINMRPLSLTVGWMVCPVGFLSLVSQALKTAPTLPRLPCTAEARYRPSTRGAE